ncbi:MAG TPA: nuclear transport factor 2 family protein [Conexibacter sp.]|nr:nuclear transport factor 2 family protein [Conexibacter sp.]
MKPLKQIAEAYELFERGEDEAVFAQLADDVEVIQTEAVPWGGHARGKDEFKALFVRLHDHVHTTATIEELIESGEDVIAIGRTRGTANATGAPIDIRIVHRWRVVDGRITLFHPFVDAPALRRAMGMQDA